MKLSTLSTSLLLSIFASAAFAQAPAAAPAGTTGLCKDGSYSNAASKSGACSGHKGIKTWYVAEPTKAEKKAEVKAEAKAEAKADKSALEKKGDVKEEKKAEPIKATTPTPAPTTPAAKVAPTAAPAVAAAGASANSVWVNTDTKVYHCPGTKYYGKTKKGAYMTVAEATAKGAHADHGKACVK